MGFRPASDGMIEYRRAWPQVSDPFVVFSLPRSRSRWVSCFLACEGVECSHDLPVSVGSIDELCDVLQRGGSVETGLTRAWRILRDRFPGVRFAVVRRPIDEVKRSAARFGWSFPDGYLESEDRRLAEIGDLPGTLTVDFKDLSREAICRALFEHCTGRIMAERHFLELNGRNIQIEMAQRMALLIQNKDRLTSLFDEIGRQITIQREDFDRFYRDGSGIFRAHYEEAGSFDGLPLDPNVEMAKGLERDENFLAVTARVGDNMVGYIVFLINPSFESRHVMLGFQNMFYVKPEFRGKLGRQLHNAAVAILKARGVKMLIMRSGVRARGPSQKFLFERLGARRMGELYALPLVD
jgi:GNAT superfamily N-acetyltransferase